jgi:hypothetical protein
MNECRNEPTGDIQQDMSSGKQFESARESCYDK